MKPNILLILIDSLRADRCYGPQKTSKTPNIDKLIQNGVYFEQAIATVATTSVALGSMFTGLYPFKTGMGGETFNELDINVPNFVKSLKEAGYNTYATTPDLARDFGLTCEFVSDDSSYDNYFGLFAGLGEQIVNKLSSNKLTEPWFFYIHLFDLHTPVMMPEKFSGEIFGKSNYEKMISAIDWWLGQIIKNIRLANTLLVLTSDHGEYIPIIDYKGTLINLEPSSTEQTLWKLGNKVPPRLYPLKKRFGSIIRKTRGKIKSSKLEDLDLSTYQKRILLDSRMKSGHRLFDDLIRIPLIFSGCKVPNNGIISQQVSQVDIFPTITELVSVSQPSYVDGKSLVPIINGTKLEEIPAYIETPPTVKGTVKKVYGIRTSKYKYLRSADGTNEILELYDLQHDPFEEYNIANVNKEIVEKLELILIKIREGSTKIKESKMSMDKKEKIREKLRKLGYV